MDQAEVEKQKLEEHKRSEFGTPADFSFKKVHFLSKIDGEMARSSRVGRLPDRSIGSNKYLTRSIWVNNNKLKSIKGIRALAEKVVEYPEEIGWLDFSFNYITQIDEEILRFPQLKILYFHGNCVESFDEIIKLRKCKHLKTITFHGNPISNLPSYRPSVVAVLPQVSIFLKRLSLATVLIVLIKIVNLDFTPVLKAEKIAPPPATIMKKLKALEAK